MSRLDPDDPHDVLGVASGAGAAEVLAAWRRMARASHPDRGGDADEFLRAKLAIDRLRHHGGGATPVGATLVRQLGPAEVARRWWRRRRDRLRSPRVV